VWMCPLCIAGVRFGSGNRVNRRINFLLTFGPDLAVCTQDLSRAPPT